VSFWRSILRTRRTPHFCATCGRAVEKGERSYDEAGLSDGEFNSYRQCIPCHDLVGRLFVNGHLGYDEAWMLYELPDLARDAGEPWPPASVDTHRMAETGTGSGRSLSGAVPKGDAQ